MFKKLMFLIHLQLNVKVVRCVMQLTCTGLFPLFLLKHVLEMGTGSMIRQINKNMKGKPIFGGCMYGASLYRLNSCLSWEET